MGAMQNNERGQKKGRGARGSVRNSSRLDGFGGRAGNGHADWGGCDPGRLQAVVVGITKLGGAVTIGMSRNLGAHSMTLMLDESRETLWFNGDAELDDELDAVIATLNAIT